MSIFSNMVYDLTQYVKRFTGTTAPSTAPDRAGSLNFDTTAKKMYASFGTSASADWKEIGSSSVTSQSGAPSSTPTEVGALNVDTTTPALYYSVGTSSSADWKQAGGGWLTATVDTTDATETEILSLAAPANAENQLHFRVGCTNSDQSKRYSAVFDAFFTSTELTASPVGVAVKKVSGDTMDVNVYIESGNVKVKVTGMAANNFDWKIHYLPIFSFPYTA